MRSFTSYFYFTFNFLLFIYYHSFGFIILCVIDYTVAYLCTSLNFQRERMIFDFQIINRKKFVKFDCKIYNDLKKRIDNNLCYIPTVIIISDNLFFTFIHRLLIGVQDFRLAI